jgi:hypothetical protein
MEIDPEQFARRILRPDRRRLAEVRARVGDMDDAREAWRVVAPGSWLADDRRGFRGYCPHCKGSCLVGVPETRCPACRGYGEATLPSPEYTDAVVALCADPAGVEAAESLARLAASRLSAWRAPAPSRIVWAVVCPTYWERSRWSSDFERALVTALAVVKAGSEAATRAWSDALAEQLERSDRPCWGSAYLDAFGAACWRDAARLGEPIVRPPEGVPGYFWVDAGAAVDGRTLDAVGDPFTPLAEIWALGYGLEIISDEAIVLVAPEIDQDE